LYLAAALNAYISPAICGKKGKLRGFVGKYLASAIWRR
jgi:hypothetical protein